MTTAELTWQAEDVILAVHGKCLHEQNWMARGVRIDSKNMNPGDLFIAIKGPNHDGHDFVAEAFTKGAVAAIVAHQPPSIPADAPLIYVENTFKALEDLGRAGRERSEASLIAVTGSVGKTGTKEMLRVILGATGNTYANEGSLNNHWGVPLSLARLPKDDRFGVFEIGMNHAGELGPLSRQVMPDVALITNIEAVHIEFFPSLEAIADAKAEIFLGMKADGVTVLNRNNAHFTRLAAAAKAHGLKRVISFGIDPKAEAKLLGYEPFEKGCKIQAEILGRPLTYLLGAQGEHLALNSLGALLAALAAGADPEAGAAALAHYQAPVGRGVTSTIRIAQGEITLIDESYNASPAAVRAALRVLSSMKLTEGGRRIFVLGDMRELGKDTSQIHADLAKDVIAAGINKFYCCGEAVAYLFEALPKEMRGFHAQDSVDLASHVAQDLHAGDIVTVKGSHSLQMERVVEAVKMLDQSSGSSGQQKIAS